MEYVRSLLSGIISDQDFVDWVCEKGGTFRFVVYQGLEAMDKDLSELELSVRAYNCLKRAKYDTINSMVADINGRRDLLKIRNMGRKSANEIMMKLFLYTYVNLKPEKQQAYLDKVREMN